MRIDLATGSTGELAAPGDEVGVRRGLVLAPDIMGLRPLFDEMCARLAAEHAWAVCAVEPFPGREHLGLDERLASMAALDDAVQVGHLVAAADALGDRFGVDRTGVLGFCMGGMYAMKAEASGRFDRVVSFYGMIRVPAEWRGPGQADALEVLDDPRRVLAVVGGRDHFTPAGDVDALEARGATVVRYPAADHGFVHDPARPAHRPADAADAWRSALDWLR